MGKISGFFNKAIKRAEEFDPVKSCQNVAQRIRENQDKKVDDFLEGAADDHSRLIVGQKPYTFKESFQIFDERENAKYVVKGKILSAGHHLTIYDAKGKVVLGKLKEKFILFRSPFALERNPKKFVVELQGKKLGLIKSRFAFGKRKFELTFNKWIVEGNILGLKYTVTNGKEKIMEVCEKAFAIGDTYYLDISKQENELLCILVLLAIDSAHTTKARDNKRTARRMKRRLKRSFWLTL